MAKGIFTYFVGIAAEDTTASVSLKLPDGVKLTGEELANIDAK